MAEIKNNLFVGAWIILIAVCLGAIAAASGLGAPRFIPAEQLARLPSCYREVLAGVLRTPDRQNAPITDRDVKRAWQACEGRTLADAQRDALSPKAD